MITWWMKLGGKRPPGDNPRLFQSCSPWTPLHGWLSDIHWTLCMVYSVVSALQSPDCVVTFTRADSFLSVSGWQHGPLGLSFRTIQTDAVLLYQPSTETFWTTAQFYMMLKEGMPTILTSMAQWDVLPPNPQPQPQLKMKSIYQRNGKNSKSLGVTRVW